MVQTYRKFDRVRGRSAFATDLDHFNTYNANKWVVTGTGTPAAALGANGGLNLTTTAGANDKTAIQRGIETGATKLENIQLRRGKKIGAVARVEHADFAGFGLFFGLAPANANPDTVAAAGITLLPTGVTATFGARTASNPDITPVALRDKLGGIDFEVYWDGQRSVSLFAGGQRVGGFRLASTDFNAQGQVTGLVANYAVSLAILNSAVATARTVAVRTIGSYIQLRPDLGVPV